jgi:hypothetical protein
VILAQQLGEQVHDREHEKCAHGGRHAQDDTLLVDLRRIVLPAHSLSPARSSAAGGEPAAQFSY